MFHKLVAPALIAALAATAPATAQDAPSLDKVMATVGETGITLGHMLALRATLPQEYSQIPADVLFEGVLDQLVQQELLRQSHEGDLSAIARLRLDNEERAVTASDVIRSIIEAAVTPDALQAAYDSEYAEAAEETEYRAAHILVETEEKAQSLVEELSGGANFAALAQEHSTGPTGPSGGELGWFSAGMMVPEFSEAVAALEVGEVSAPVQTQFGWHVIKLNETRIKERPALDDVRDELADTLRRQALEAQIAQLEAQAKVDRSGAEGLSPDLINRFDLLEN